MAAGGIYDHLGGGFARYSVDERWAVPHFEKMLYDNGQLVKLYADAYRVTGKRSWRRVFEETITYVLRDMTHPDGGFYASEDADSEGEEGKFYVWTPAQVKAVLGESDGAIACALLRLYELTGHDLYRNRAEHVFRMYGAAAAKNAFSFAHLLSAQDFQQQVPLEIILAGDKLGATALVEGVHRAYLPARVLAFSEDVPIGQGRQPIDGQPAAYVCRNRTCSAPVTTAEALIESCSELSS
ncbi:MAG: thioredoxin [Caulobacteraceae bacterium]|nr:thioredoxin [Caulobacteraceae bacterium]